MKALLDHVPQHERLVVIEQPAELKVNHSNAVRWEAVDAIPGQVAITPSQLLAAALRHRPDRWYSLRISLGVTALLRPRRDALSSSRC